jgi:hypothetical protein
MRFPDFIPAKREDSTDLARAAAFQNYGDMQANQLNAENREKMISGPVDAYKGYVSITDTNPLADAVRKWTGGPAGDGTAGGELNKMGPGSGGRGTTVPHPSGSGLPNTTEAVNQSASTGSMPGGTANAPTFMQGGQEMLTGGSGSPIAMPTSTAVPQMAGEQAASMLADTGAAAGVDAASQAGTQGATEAAGKGMSPLVGQIGGPVLGAASAGYLESQKPNTSDGKIAIKAGGGAASGSLMAFTPALAAAGPVGWAGIAGLAALSLYGMLS